jgi:LCP family protein required for cell wall assembly
MSISSADPRSPAPGNEVGSVAEPEPVAADGAAEVATRRRRWPRIVLISGLALIVLAAGGTFAGWRYLRSLEGQVTRVPVFDAVPEAERPTLPPTPTAAMNVLILGRDTWVTESDDSRTDTIMLAHVTGDNQSAQIVSFPRDTWVTIPGENGGRGRKDKINAAFPEGGIPLVVRTIELLTKIRIDHVLVIDFAGFAQIVDALGGIDVTIEKDFRSIHKPYRQYKAGLQHLAGAEALDYSRQRKQFANGDFSRIEHQQDVVKAILQKATTAGIVTDPGRLTSFLSATAKSISADDDFDLIGTALAFRGIASHRIRFITNPSSGTGTERGQAVVYLDEDTAQSLYEAINDDTAATWQEPSPGPSRSSSPSPSREPATDPLEE